MRKDTDFLFQNEDVERTVFVHKQLVDPGQLSLKGMRNVYRPKCGDALRLGVKEGIAHSTCGCG